MHFEVWIGEDHWSQPIESEEVLHHIKNIWTIPNVSENIDDVSFMNDEAIILRDFIAKQ